MQLKEVSCRRNKLLSERRRLSAAESPPALKPANLSEKKYIISGKVYTGRDRLSRQSRLACRRRAAPASIYRRQRKARRRKKPAAAQHDRTNWDERASGLRLAGRVRAYRLSNASHDARLQRKRLPSRRAQQRSGGSGALNHLRVPAQVLLAGVNEQKNARGTGNVFDKPAIMIFYTRIASAILSLRLCG
jgi:hypothetical protein